MGCNRCSNGNSEKEYELLEFIKSNYNGEIVGRTREFKKYELDIYLPKLKIAFEYNGMYWHSTESKEKNYHYDKSKFFEDRGIRLIMIWEDEWLMNNQKIKSYLRDLLLKKKIYYARKLLMKEVNRSQQITFLNKNHLQGYFPSSVCLGLYDGEQLIQLLSLRKVKGSTYEIGRICTLSGNIVVGGSEKLFSNIKNLVVWSKIVSYNNRDKFAGQVYEKLGMKKEKDSESFFYSKNLIRHNRRRFQKAKLIKDGFDKNKTGNQIMKERGYLIIYTSGNSKFTITK